MTQLVSLGTVVTTGFSGIVALGVINAMSAAMGASFGVAAGIATGSKSNPDGISDETSKILRRSGLGAYKPPPFGAMYRETERTRERKPPDSVREREIGPYSVYMETRGQNAQIRLYHYTAGGHSKRIGTWTGSLAAGEAQFEKVSDVVHAVRFEEKTALMR